jgi:hypothetical protein
VDDLARAAAALERIAAALERHTGPPDPAAALLTLIAEFVGARVFTVRELVSHAAMPEHASLRLEIANVVTLEHQAKRLGKLFERIEGLPIAGLRLQRVTREAAGVVWSIVRM